MKKLLACFALLCALAPLPSFAATTTASGTATASKTTSGDTYERAVVREAKTASETIPGGAQQKQIYVVEFLSGPLKGKTKELSSDLLTNPYQLSPKPGDRIVILLQQNPDGGEPLAYIEGFDRLGAMIWLLVLFVVTLVLLAGWQGLKVAGSIIISVALIGWVLIPSFLGGLNPIPIAMGLAVVLATISSVTSMGWNKKSWVTIVGTLGGVLVAYLISKVFGSWSHLTGLSSDDDRLFFDNNPLLNPQSLLFAGIIIAAMGVVEDVAVSIASGVVEVQHANPRSTFKQLFRSGMVIGRDHMSALVNTLIFAYVGASLSTLLLYSQFGGSWLKFLNFDTITDEVIRSLSGTIGLVFTVPITALLAAIACLRLPTKPSENQGGHHHGHS